MALPGRTTLKFLILFTGATAVAAVLTAKPAAHASATIIVNTATDDSASGDGLCSLRKAINNANAKGDTTGGDCNPGSGNDTIAVAVLSGTLALNSSLPTIENTLTIVGPGQAVPINGGGSGFVIFGIAPTATATLKDLAIENTDEEIEFSGQGVVNFGTLTVTGCTIQYTTSGANGAGIANGGTLTVSDSFFYNNGAPSGSGGAIANDNGTASVTNSTFFSNFAVNGGAIYNGQNKRFTVTNSTFSNNTAYTNGSSCYNDLGGVLEIGGTILAGAGGPLANECNYPATTQISDLSYNISDDFSCNLVNSDATAGASGQTLGDEVDPELDPSGAQDNGGETDTIALDAGSPAIAAIPAADCPATDQRGVTRPASGQTACDVGAYEGFVATPTPTPTATATATATPTSTPTPVSGKLKVSPKTLKFGDIVVNQAVTKMVTVTNIGKISKKNHPSPILIEMESTSGSPTPSPFSVTTQCEDDLTPRGKGVSKSETTCQVAVHFEPTQAVSYSGTLTIVDNLEPSEMQSVRMTGKGIAAK